MHDAVAWRNNINVFKGFLGPVDKVEPVFIASVFDGAVLVESVLLEARVFHRQRVVDDELRGHHGVNQRRITAFGRNGIAQAGQVNQRGLTQDVVTDDACRKPGEVQVPLALDDLLKRVGERGRAAAAHQVFGQYA